MKNDPNRFDVSRRSLIRGAVGVAVVGASSSAIANCSGGGMQGGTIDAGAVANYSVGTFTATGSVIVGRDAGGLYAYTRICTHEGCSIPAPADASSTSSCPCHMSHFDANGDVQPGSLATRNLDHYAVVINSGNVMVDTSMVLTDRSTRTPVA